jgi:hypothetical protein
MMSFHVRLKCLALFARRSGKGLVNGSGIDFRTLRNDWVKNRDFNPLPAKDWKETLRDVLDDIAMYDEASKLKIRQCKENIR